MKKFTLSGYLPIIIISFLMIYSVPVSAQYFGRNKVHYHDLDFRRLKSPHFDIYHYVDDTTIRNRIAQRAEQWYQMHQQVFRDTFKDRNPIILYNGHADFQQTNTISGLVSVGTGGVTEALKNRVIFPFMGSNAQTDHVLGHELVHAFQYHLLKSSDSLSFSNVNNLPLWMVEGMAEYMSIGYIDPNTAMWMRSAVLEDKLPSLKDLTNKPDVYFPYRWGEAFWAYVTGIWGDAIIRKLFIETAKRGYKESLKKVLGLDEKAFTKNWQDALKSNYTPYLKETSTKPVGEDILNKNNAGEVNIIPTLSPDGRYIAFWSEKNVFGLNLYLANAQTGNIIKKLTSHSYTSHIDQYSSFESSVAWSPDSKRIAFVAYKKGQNQLIIVNTEGDIQNEFSIPGLLEFENPSWSPDGKTIVVTGLKNGQGDLYAYHPDTKEVEQLTDDLYSELQPSFSPDGKWITFSTDRNSFTAGALQHNFTHQVALMNVATHNIRVLDFFAGASNLNPVFASDNHTIFFLSDFDGFRNLYSYDMNTFQLSKLTNFYTGISGITLFSPAISTSRRGKHIVYSYYTNDNYVIYNAEEKNFNKTVISDMSAKMQAAQLPPFTRQGHDIVETNIAMPNYEKVAVSRFEKEPYRDKLHLDYISNSGGIGISTGGYYGTGVAGGIDGIFSDMLGNKQLYGTVSLNGQVYDFGGQVAYLNLKHQFNWGVSASHIPYLSGIQRIMADTLTINNDTVAAVNLSTDLIRTFQDEASVYGAFPFSQTQRIEAGGAFARYYYRIDRYSDYYSEDGYYLGNTHKKLDAPEGFNFGQAYLAYVGDNSQFGVASPLIGHRFRIEAGRYFGFVNLYELLGDYRRYFRLSPFTLATRNYFNGRLGKDAESGVIPPLYIGDPYFIRGYEALDFANGNGRENITINDLIGSKIFVSNVELRFPFTGPERLSAIRSRWLMTELAIFTDGGIAWGHPESPSSTIAKQGELVASNSKIILSSGISLRINLFGYIIIEPYYAIPWQNGGFSNGKFGLNFLPGY